MKKIIWITIFLLCLSLASALELDLIDPENVLDQTTVQKINSTITQSQLQGRIILHTFDGLVDHDLVLENYAKKPAPFVYLIFDRSVVLVGSKDFPQFNPLLFKPSELNVGIDQNRLVNVVEKTVSILEGEEVKSTEIPSGENNKDASLYSDKTVFLVSDKNWQDVLSLVPVAVWTEGSEIKKYPLLIYHTEEEKKEINFGEIEGFYRWEDYFYGEQLTGTITTQDGTYPIYEFDKKFTKIKDSRIYHPISLYSRDKANSKKINLGEKIILDVTIRNNNNTHPLEIKKLVINLKGYFGDSFSEYEAENLGTIGPDDDKTFKTEFEFLKPIPRSIDPDSIIYFLQQYGVERILAIGNDAELNKLLVTKKPLGAEVDKGNINSLSSWDYLLFWKNFKQVVYVENDYELALVASTYASLINAPLIIKDTPLDNPTNLKNRYLICVGNPGGQCNEKYSLDQLQQKYLDKTNTNKIILVNPLDFDFKLIYPLPFFSPQLKKYPIPFYEQFGKNSLAAPVLASGKHELIISTPLTNYSDVDQYLVNKLDSLNLRPKYLTIIASLYNIEMFHEFVGSNSAVDAADTHYANINPQTSLGVGRIYGITVSDASSNIARSLFYKETLKNDQDMLISVGAPAGISASVVYILNIIFSQAGYKVKAITDLGEGDGEPKDWENKFFIYFTDHGSPSHNGISRSEIPYLDNSFVFLRACSSCAADDSFCTRAIRRGAIGVIGAVETIASGFDKSTVYGEHFLNAIFTEELTLGEAFHYDGHNQYILLGDPTLQLKTTHLLPRPQLKLVSENLEGADYLLIVPSINFWIDKPEILDSNDKGYLGAALRYTTAYDQSLKTQDYFKVRIDLKGFDPTKFSGGWAKKKDITTEVISSVDNPQKKVVISTPLRIDNTPWDPQHKEEWEIVQSSLGDYFLVAPDYLSGGKLNEFGDTEFEIHLDKKK